MSIYKIRVVNIKVLFRLAGLLVAATASGGGSCATTEPLELGHEMVLTTKGPLAPGHVAFRVKLVESTRNSPGYLPVQNSYEVERHGTNCTAAIVKPKSIYQGARGSGSLVSWMSYDEAPTPLYGRTEWVMDSYFYYEIDLSAFMLRRKLLARLDVTGKIISSGNEETFQLLRSDLSWDELLRKIKWTVC